MAHPHGHLVIMELQAVVNKLGWSFDDEIVVCYRVFLYLSDILLEAVEKEEISLDQAFELIQTADLSRFCVSHKSVERAETARTAYLHALQETKSFMDNLHHLIVHEIPKRFIKFILALPQNFDITPDKLAALQLLQVVEGKLRQDEARLIRDLITYLDHEVPQSLDIQNQVTRAHSILYRALGTGAVSTRQFAQLAQPLRRLGRQVKHRHKKKGALDMTDSQATLSPLTEDRAVELLQAALEKLGLKLISYHNLSTVWPGGMRGKYPFRTCQATISKNGEEGAVDATFYVFQDGVMQVINGRALVEMSTEVYEGLKKPEWISRARPMFVEQY